MRYRLIALVALVISCLIQHSKAASYSNSISNSTQAATAASTALVTLKSLALKDYAGLGFSSTNEASNAKTGEPLQIYRIALKPLQEYLLGQDFNSLLEVDASFQPARRVTVPVYANGDVKSSISMRMDGTTWGSEKLGRPELIRSLMKELPKVPNNSRNPGILPFAVEVEVFDIWFIGYYNMQNKLVLLTIMDMQLGPIFLQRDKPMTSPAMFRLAAAAQRYNDKPN
jgi:hypothetical protein